MNKNSKTESTMPAQSRISVLTLASLDRYWLEHGYGIKTMSQLINWSLELLVDVLKNNGKCEEFQSVGDARGYLVGRGLCQDSMMKRGRQKLGTAIMFENMRDEGIDPRTFAKRDYGIVHRKNAVTQPTVRSEGGRVTEITRQALETYADLHGDADGSLSRHISKPTISESKKGKWTEEDSRNFEAADRAELEEQERANEEFLRSLQGKPTGNGN